MQHRLVIDLKNKIKKSVNKSIIYLLLIIEILNLFSPVAVFVSPALAQTQTTSDLFKYPSLNNFSDETLIKRAQVLVDLNISDSKTLPLLKQILNKIDDNDNYVLSHVIVSLYRGQVNDNGLLYKILVMLIDGRMVLNTEDASGVNNIATYLNIFFEGHYLAAANQIEPIWQSTNTETETNTESATNIEIKENIKLTPAAELTENLTDVGINQMTINTIVSSINNISTELINVFKKIKELYKIGMIGVDVIIRLISDVQNERKTADQVLKTVEEIEKSMTPIVNQPQICTSSTEIVEVQKQEPVTTYKKGYYEIIGRTSQLTSAEKGAKEVAINEAVRKYREAKRENKPMLTDLVRYNRTLNIFVVKVKKDSSTREYWYYEVKMLSTGAYATKLGDESHYVEVENYLNNIEKQEQLILTTELKTITVQEVKITHSPTGCAEDKQLSISEYEKLQQSQTEELINIFGVDNNGNICRATQEIIEVEKTVNVLKTRMVTQEVIERSSRLTAEDNTYKEIAIREAIKKYLKLKNYSATTVVKTDFVLYNRTQKTFVIKVKKDSPNKEYWYFKVRMEAKGPDTDKLGDESHMSGVDNFLNEMRKKEHSESYIAEDTIKVKQLKTVYLPEGCAENTTISLTSDDLNLELYKQEGNYNYDNYWLTRLAYTVNNGKDYTYGKVEEPTKPSNTSSSVNKSKVNINVSGYNYQSINFTQNTNGTTSQEIANQIAYWQQVLGNMDYKDFDLSKPNLSLSSSDLSKYKQNCNNSNNKWDENAKACYLGSNNNEYVKCVEVKTVNGKDICIAFDFYELRDNGKYQTIEEIQWVEKQGEVNATVYQEAQYGGEQIQQPSWWESITNWAKNAWNKLTGIVEDVWVNGKKFAAKVIDGAIHYINEAGKYVVRKITQAAGWVTRSVEDIMSEVKAKYGDSKIYNIVQQGGKLIFDYAVKTVNTVDKWLSNYQWYRTAKNVVSSTATKVVDYIKNLEIYKAALQGWQEGRAKYYADKARVLQVINDLGIKLGVVKSEEEKAEAARLEAERLEQIKIEQQNWGLDLINETLNDKTGRNNAEYNLEVLKHIQIPVNLIPNINTTDIERLKIAGVTNINRNAYVTIIAPEGIDLNNINLSDYEIKHFYHGWLSGSSGLDGESYMTEYAREYLNQKKNRIAVVYNFEQMYFSPPITVENAIKLLANPIGLSQAFINYLLYVKDAHVYGAALTVDPTIEQVISYLKDNSQGDNIDQILNPTNKDAFGHSLGTITAQHYMKTYNEINNTNGNWDTCMLNEPPSQTSLTGTPVDIRNYQLNPDGSEPLNVDDFFKNCNTSLAITAGGSIAASLGLAQQADLYLTVGYGYFQQDHTNTNATGSLITEVDYKLPIPHISVNGSYNSLVNMETIEGLVGTDVYEYFNGAFAKPDDIRKEIDNENRKEIAYIEVQNLPKEYLTPNEVKYLESMNCKNYKIIYGSNATNNYSPITSCEIIRSDGGKDILTAPVQTETTVVIGKAAYLNGDTGDDELYTCADLRLSSNDETLKRECTSNKEVTLTGGSGNDKFVLAEQHDMALTIITDFRANGIQINENGEEETDNDILVLPANWAGNVQVCNNSVKILNICEISTGKVLASLSGNFSDDFIDQLDGQNKSDKLLNLEVIYE